MMWNTLIQTVATALQTTLTTTATVRTASDAEVPDTPTVVIRRGSQPARHLFTQLSGAENLVLECWTQDDDPDAANLKLEALEDAVMDALRTLPRVDPITNIAITGIDPDGDLFRPIVGSQISITITWRQMRR